MLEGEEALFLQIYNCMNVWILGASENPVTVSHCHRIKSHSLMIFKDFYDQDPIFKCLLAVL